MLTALFSSLISLQPATAQPAREDGLFVSVPSPISSDVVDSIKAKTLGAIDRGKRNGRSIRTVVFDFNPGPQPGGLPSSTTDYGACRALAVFIRDLEDLLKANGYDLPVTQSGFAGFGHLLPDETEIARFANN